MERLADTAIFPPGPGDAAGLARVHVQSWRETYRGLLPGAYLAAMDARIHARRWRLQLTRARPDELVLAAEGPGGLIGYCAGAFSTGEESGGRAELFTLYLVRSAQKTGLGRRLLTSAARVFSARGARRLGLWVLNGNTGARGFYHHLGGRAGPERPVSGWGGGFRETAYVWEDITTLARGH